MSSVYGEALKVSIFGQSHGPAIGVTIDGLPAGFPIDMEALAAFLRRRSPGRNPYSTPRKEADLPEFLSGLRDGVTCGAPLAAVIRNENTRSGDYAELRDVPRPAHADYTAEVKYGGFQDSAGGGHFSARLTAPLCIAGGICLQVLARYGVRVFSHIASIGEIEDRPFDPMAPEAPGGQHRLPGAGRGGGRGHAGPISPSAGRSATRWAAPWSAPSPACPPGSATPSSGAWKTASPRPSSGIPALKGLEFGSGFGGFPPARQRE